MPIAIMPQNVRESPVIASAIDAYVAADAVAARAPRDDHEAYRKAWNTCRAAEARLYRLLRDWGTAYYHAGHRWHVDDAGELYRNPVTVSLRFQNRDYATTRDTSKTRSQAR